MSLCIRVCTRLVLTVSLTGLALGASPAAGASASIRATAEIVYPTGIVAVPLIEPSPVPAIRGHKKPASQRHRELLLYPGRASESIIAVNAATDRQQLVRFESTSPAVVVDTTTLTTQATTVITVIPISQ